MRVAVVIPCYNIQEHLRVALDSVLHQHHADLDIVCVDDGSTDGTADVLKEYVAAHPARIRVLTQQNLGAAAARNAGLKRTEGAYVQFLDADDVLLPDKISEQVHLAEQHGSPDVVIGDFEQVMPDGLLLPTLAEYDRPWMGLIRTRLGTTSANLWKRTALEAVGGWREDLRSSQDYDLLFRLLKNEARITWDRRIATQVLKRATGSISQSSVSANWDRYLELRIAIKEYLTQRDAARFRDEIGTLRQYIFMALRIVAAEDLAKAKRLYAHAIGSGFRPQVGRAITERYALLHNLLGFGTTERLLRLLKRPPPAP
jgi:glycosyltransferase involved in cell wall biosynthesis